MTTRVNGGYLNGQFLTGSLRHFALTGADFSAAIADADVTVNGRDYEAGQPIPGSAAEEVYRVLAQRCTPVIMFIDDAGALHVALENTSTAWLNEYDPDVGANKDGVPANAALDTAAVEVLQEVLVDLGATAGFDDVDMTAIEVTETPYVVRYDSVADRIATTL